MGPEKVVVLAGYKTVKEALVNRAEEFGDRQAMLIIREFNQGHGNEKLSPNTFVFISAHKLK